MFSLDSPLYRFGVWLLQQIRLQFCWLLGTLAGIIVLGVYPATYAMVATQRQMIREDLQIPVWNTFWKYYKEDWKRANALGLISTLVFVVLVIYQRLSTQVDKFATFYVFLAYAFIILFIILNLWLPVVNSHYDLKIKDVYKSAAILMFSAPYNSFGMGALVLIFIWATDRWFILLPIVMVAMLGYLITKLGLNAINRITALNEERGVPSLHKPKTSIVDLPEVYLKTIEKAPGTDRQYLGQPDLVLLNDNKTLYSVYPVGHGHGPLVLQKSTDQGETWQEVENTPSSWKNSLETPTLYRLDLTDGSQVLVLICARPNWQGNETGGFDCSYSYDNGLTWTEFETYHTYLDSGKVNYSVVAMASLIQLKEDGQFVDKWLGVYHSPEFINYGTILSFEDGAPTWSKPYRLFVGQDKVEQSAKICELGLIRDRDSDQILALARSQSHQEPSKFFTSDNEGVDWSQAKDLPPDLYGERHRLHYDGDTDRLIVSFREIELDVDRDGNISKDDWLAGDWIVWVGTYSDIIEQTPGSYRIRIAKDYTPSEKGGDTGYAGVVQLLDGKFVMHSYGHFDEEFSKNFEGSVTDDLCYIKQAKFSLADVERVYFDE